MTEVATSHNFNKTEINVKNLGLELDACLAAEVDGILKAAADGQLWKTMEKTENKCIPEPVIEAAEFAVRKHNEEAKTHLVLLSVLNWYIAADRLYGLLISVKDDTTGSTHKASALVSRPSIGPMTLIWWKDLLSA